MNSSNNDHDLSSYSVDTDITYEKRTPQLSPISPNNNDGSLRNNHIELVDLITQLSPENRDFLLHRIKSDDKLFIDQKAKAKKVYICITYSY